MMNKQNSAPVSIFRFELSPASKERLDSLFTEVSALQRDFEVLPESQRLLLQPFFERFLHLLSNLGKDLMLVEGNCHIETTGTMED